jgi:NADH:ubiquinone oxidoreductase subunit F (NADH-binding)
MIVADETTCMVSLPGILCNLCDESCVSPPAASAQRMLETLDRITAGKGVLEDLDELRRLA